MVCRLSNDQFKKWLLIGELFFFVLKVVSKSYKDHVMTGSSLCPPTV